ncbi:MAG: T9SS type A sorting domain-containing protein [Chitinophagales bacterium]|nr:T9SS type A sorting domain-containing protein [Chitinophagales bacterium]
MQISFRNVWVVMSLLLSVVAYGQEFQRLDVPVYKDGKLLSLLNAGGLRSPQFSNIDFDGDGMLDLFVFDKNGDVILPFVKIGTPGTLDFRFAPEYIARFPKLQAWTLLVDYNGDGIKDIFTSSSVLPNCCIEVWKGNRDVEGKIFYEQVTFDNLPFRDILQFQIGGSYTNIYVSAVDLPAIVDVDGDGDIDIISFEPDGSYASFYKNVAVEEGLGADALKFIRQDICWGKFSEDQYSEILSVSSSPFSCAHPFTGGGNTGIRHAGSTLTIFDMNGDGLLDLLLGDIDSPRLVKLTNGGSPENAWMREIEMNFPVDDVPVDLGYFISAFYVDANGDGKRDLIVTPNDVSIGENNNHIWLYLNNGSDAAPIFNLNKKDFLVDQMPFFYGGTHPAFADVNNDGLVDIVLGINSILKKNNQYENRLILLLNTGTATHPVFHVADEDYLGFSRETQYVGRLAPAFGDLDGDGRPDLLIGDAYGQLYFFKNIGAPGHPYDFAPAIYPYFDIFVGQNAKPLIMDMDGDGLMDLVVGKKNNELNFFKNQGTATEPIFSFNPGSAPNVRQLGNIFTGNDYYTQNGAPAIITLHDGKRRLIMGSEAASFRSYEIPENFGSDYTLEATNLGQVYEGRKVVPAFYDINNDGYYEMVVGNERGGLSFYTTSFKMGTSSVSNDYKRENTLVMFPNPASHLVYVASDLSDAVIQLRDVQGRILSTFNNGAYNVLDRSIPDGLYLITVSSGQGYYTEKLVIRR